MYFEEFQRANIFFNCISDEMLRNGQNSPSHQCENEDASLVLLLLMSLSTICRSVGLQNNLLLH